MSDGKIVRKLSSHDQSRKKKTIVKSGNMELQKRS